MHTKPACNLCRRVHVHLHIPTLALRISPSGHEDTRACCERTLTIVLRAPLDSYYTLAADHGFACGQACQRFVPACLWRAPRTRHNSVDVSTSAGPQNALHRPSLLAACPEPIMPHTIATSQLDCSIMAHGLEFFAFGLGLWHLARA